MESTVRPGQASPDAINFLQFTIAAKQHESSSQMQSSSWDLSFDFADDLTIDNDANTVRGVFERISVV